jgi:hypothetical protein
MKKILFIFILALLSIQIITSQTFLSVEINNPVYVLLDSAEQRKLLNFLPPAKPYSKAVVINLLKKLDRNRRSLSNSEKDVLDYYLEDLSDNSIGSNPLSWGSEGDKDSPGTFQTGFIIDGDYRVNGNNLPSWHMYNGLVAYMKGDISSFLSYYGSAGGSVNKVAPDLFYNNVTLWVSRFADSRDLYPYYITDNVFNLYNGNDNNYTTPGTFAPYQFYTNWDGHHTDPFTSGLNDGVSNVPMVALITRDELTAQFYKGDLTLRWGKIRREWGQGDGSLYLSGSAHPFEGFEAHVSPVSWFNYSFTVGSLGNWFVDSYINNNLVTNEFLEDGITPNPDYDPLLNTGITTNLGMFSEQKMISIQQMSITPTDWLSLLVSSSAIWGKRFEMAYLSPLLLPFMTQEFNGDFDNVSLTLGFAMRLPKVGKVYGSLFLDETSGSSFEEIFKYARSMYAYQGGIQTPISFLPFGTMTLQYTKINPFVYAHYFEEEYSSSSVPVSLSYTNEGQNLGYFLPPNSDEIMLKIETFPKPNLLTTFKYQLIRHGTNSATDFDGDGIPDGQIYGDIYIPYDYSTGISYPFKDFLNDGVYDWSNIISLKGEYQFSNYPLTVGLEYFFSHTFWDRNGIAVDVPEPIFQNVVALTFKLYN